jgi:flagellar M-ring protein FliF
LSKFFQQLKEFYEKLDARARRILIGATALSILVLVSVGWWASQTNFVPLLSGEGMDKVRRVAGALELGGVPYEVSNDGTELRVPDNAMGQAWILASSVDVLPGLNDVADMPKVLTPGQQDWAFTRAREGDIARMINEIDAVAGSRVNIVPREEGTYFGEERPATASVLVRMVPGRKLSGPQIKGIVNVVASAVDGLTPDAISLVDEEGALLHGGGSKLSIGASGQMGELAEYRGQLESKYEAAVRSALLPVLGFGSDFSVTTSVDLDLTSSEKISKTIETDSQALISEQVQENSTQDASSGGVPGVDANQTERPANTGRSQASESMSSTFNYAYPTVEEVSRKNAGGVNRLSVAVQVNSVRLEALAAVTESKTVEDFEAQIESAVKAAVGFDAERNDLVKVNFIPFVETELIESAGGGALFSNTSWMRYLLSAFGLVMFFLYIVKPVMGQLVPIADAKAAKARAEEEEEEDHSGSDLVTRLRKLVDNYESVDAGDLNNLIERESEAAAQVIRLWTRHG